jgi:hypothetical protein
MAGTTIVNQVTLGNSATDTQNFALKTNVDGTMKLARKSDGSGGDVLTVDANGRVAMPQNVVAFSAYPNAVQSIPANVFTKVSLQVEEFDTANAFSSGTVVTNTDTSNRFTPQVAGYYQFNAAVGLATTATSLLASIYKNGSEYKRGTLSGTNALQAVNVSALVYLNGSTDYVELFTYQNIGSAVNTQASQATVNFQGILIAKA